MSWSHIAFFSCNFDAINSEVQAFWWRFLMSFWAESQHSREKTGKYSGDLNHNWSSVLAVTSANINSHGHIYVFYCTSMARQRSVSPVYIAGHLSGRSCPTPWEIEVIGSNIIQVRRNVRRSPSPASKVILHRWPFLALEFIHFSSPRPSHVSVFISTVSIQLPMGQMLLKFDKSVKCNPPIAFPALSWQGHKIQWSESRAAPKTSDDFSERFSRGA